MKAQAREYESFKRLCIGLAQRLHRADVRLRMGLMGSEHASKVRPLNENKAIENGATFLSETFIFSVAGGLILFESWRQRQKELTRRENVADDIRTLQYEIDYLKTKLKDHIKFDDYVPPAEYKPSVLKLEPSQLGVVEKAAEQLESKVDNADRDRKAPPPSVTANPGTVVVKGKEEKVPK